MLLLAPTAGHHWPALHYSVLCGISHKWAMPCVLLLQLLSLTQHRDVETPPCGSIDQ